jgi:UDP-N-acetylmuramoyl-L-alanyl-D-glutamate--2,6-diaminopimelate ligase
VPRSAAAPPLIRVHRPPLPPGPYLVAGLGRAGTAAVALLSELAAPSEIVAWDASPQDDLRALRDRLRRAGIRCELGTDGTELLADAAIRCVVKSPGIPLDHQLVTAAAGRGTVVLDELEVAWRTLPMPVVGVTGTKGKSTVTTLVAAVGAAATGSSQMAGNTDFAPALSAVDRAAGGVIACEVSSQQLEGCSDFLPDIAVFTNIHLESNRHGSPSATAAIKQTMFTRGTRTAPVAVLNADDDRSPQIGAAVTARGGRLVTYGASATADFRIAEVEWDLDSARVALTTPAGPLELETRLPGRRNAVNAAAALAVGVELGLSVESAAKAIAAVAPPPGRYEAVDRGQPFDVLVDMAHTYESVEEVLATLRRIVDRRAGAKLRTVLGIPGTASMPEPRLLTGRVARQRSDQLFVTGTSLRGEPPLLNMASLLRGARAAEGGELYPVLDRAQAIERAIAAAQPGDVVVIVGRGPLARTTFDRHGGMVSRSDMELAADALERRPAS